MVFPTPTHALCDPQGRPYFLWDADVTLEEFEAKLQDPDPAIRALWIGKLLRQAKPDDVTRFVSLDDIRSHWQWLAGRLGRENAMWHWLVWESGWTGG